MTNVLNAPLIVKFALAKRILIVLNVKVHLAFLKIGVVKFARLKTNNLLIQKMSVWNAMQLAILVMEIK